MRACVCVCYLTGFSPNSSAPCRAVTAHSAVVAGATRIRKNNMKQFKKPCRREKGKESERDYLISFSACHANWRLSSPPVGDGRGEVGRVHGPEEKKAYMSYKHAQQICQRHQTEISDRSQNVVLFSARQILNYLRNLTIFNLQLLYQLM